MPADPHSETPLERLKRIRAEIAGERETRRTPYQRALEGERRERDVQRRRDAFVVLKGGGDA